MSERLDRPTVRVVGDCAVLVEVADTEHALALADALRSEHAGRLADVVPGHRTVLIRWPTGQSAPVADWSRFATAVGTGEARDDPELVLDVRYDGPDLPAVASAAGLSVEEVVTRHRTSDYRVAFVGFAPGFGYLIGGDPRLRVPRRAEPRAEVPGGSLAIAGPYSTVYPSRSPGGWHLIGSTDAVMFEPQRTPPALLEPGMRVRLRER